MKGRSWTDFFLSCAVSSLEKPQRRALSSNHSNFERKKLRKKFKSSNKYLKVQTVLEVNFILNPENIPNLKNLKKKKKLS